MGLTIHTRGNCSIVTYIMLQGSFRLLTRQSAFNFSFLVEGNLVFTYLYPACDGLISHQGQSVSIISLSIGIDLITSKLSSVFMELNQENQDKALGVLGWICK